MVHPIMQWLVEHDASVMNRYVVENNGLTAYQRLHGRRATSRAVEFGETVFYHAPKKLWSKMQLRWRSGIDMGVAGHSGERYIGTWTGDVVRTRSILRVVQQARWKTDVVDRLLGTAARPTPSGRYAYKQVE